MDFTNTTYEGKKYNCYSKFNLDDIRFQGEKIKLTDFQKNIIYGSLEPGFNVAHGSRQNGKTLALAIAYKFIKTFYPGCNVKYYNSLLNTGIVQYFKKYLDDIDLGIKISDDEYFIPPAQKVVNVTLVDEFEYAKEPNLYFKLKDELGFNDCVLLVGCYSKSCPADVVEDINTLPVVADYKNRGMIFENTRCCFLYCRRFYFSDSRVLNTLKNMLNNSEETLNKEMCIPLFREVPKRDDKIKDTNEKNKPKKMEMDEYFDAIAEAFAVWSKYLKNLKEVSDKFGEPIITANQSCQIYKEKFAKINNIEKITFKKKEPSVSEKELSDKEKQNCWSDMAMNILLNDCVKLLTTWLDLVIVEEDPADKWKLKINKETLDRLVATMESEKDSCLLPYSYLTHKIKEVLNEEEIQWVIDFLYNLDLKSDLCRSLISKLYNSEHSRLIGGYYVKLIAYPDIYEGSIVICYVKY